MHFDTHMESILIGDVNYSLLTVTNFDALYQQLIDKGMDHEDVADERIPYWAELWPSAIALARHIAAHPHLLQQKQVLEIGSGLGLPSIAAASSGAHVTCTDYLSDAVHFAERNATLNQVSNITFQTMDWRQPPPHRYDILLASDVAYDRSQFDHLLTAFETMIHPEGSVIFSEPNRYIAQPFLEKLTQRHYQIKKTAYEIDHKSVISKISVYEVSSALRD